MRFRAPAMVAALALVVGAGAAACAPKATTAPLTVDGQRVVLHYAATGQPQPLVIALHGIGSDGAAFEKDTGLNAFADAHGFAVAYPDAHVAPQRPAPVPTPSPTPTPTAEPTPTAAPTPEPTPTDTATPSPSGLSVLRAQRASPLVEAKSTTTASTYRAWDAGICCGGSIADDVTYLRHVVTAVEHRMLIDPRRVYVIGLSNGGMMALRAICSAPTVFAAAGTVAGPYLGTTCARPIWRHLHGGRDLIVPYSGGTPPGNPFLGVAPDWCLCQFPDSATEPARFSRSTVSVDLVPLGVHSWPTLGDGAWNLDANRDLWAFVSRYHL